VAPPSRTRRRGTLLTERTVDMTLEDFRIRTREMGLHWKNKWKEQAAYHAMECRILQQQLLERAMQDLAYTESKIAWLNKEFGLNITVPASPILARVALASCHTLRVDECVARIVELNREAKRPASLPDFTAGVLRIGKKVVANWKKMPEGNRPQLDLLDAF